MDYKLRAECLQDVVTFISKLDTQINDYRIIRMGKAIPDVIFIFNTDLELDELNFCLEYIEDSHVMHETINYKHLYTGIRHTLTVKQQTSLC